MSTSQPSESRFSEYFNSMKIFSRSLCVGGVSAAISKTAVAPIERVKIILQVQATHPDMPASERYTGFFDAMIQLWKKQPATKSILTRPLFYWRGNCTNVMRYFPMQAINFASKSRFKEYFLPRDRVEKGEFSYGGELVRKLAAGGAAGATGISVVYPMDLARTRMTSDTGVGRKYKGLVDCIVRRFRAQGLKSLYKGYFVSVGGIIPYRAVYFGFYDHALATVKKWRADENGNVELSFQVKWAISQTTSILSQFIAYPFDTVRRRMQVGGNIYPNARHCARLMLRNEGLKSFYAGCWINSIRATGCALCLVFYDSIGKFLFLDKDFGGH